MTTTKTAANRLMIRVALVGLGVAELTANVTMMIGVLALTLIGIGLVLPGGAPFALVLGIPTLLVTTLAYKISESFQYSRACAKLVKRLERKL